MHRDLVIAFIPIAAGLAIAYVIARHAASLT